MRKFSVGVMASFILMMTTSLAYSKEVLDSKQDSKEALNSCPVYDPRCGNSKE